MEGIDQFRRALTDPLTLFWTEVAAFLPSLLAALALLTIGYLVGRALQLFSERILLKAGLDRVCEKIGVTDILSGIANGLTVTRILGVLSFWFVFLAFFISAADALQLPRFSSAVDALVSYLPNLLGAIAILLIGFSIIDQLRKYADTLFENMGIEYARAVKTTILLLVGIVTVSLTIRQLNIETALLDQVVSIFLVATTFAISLAMGLGCREVVGNVIAGIYLRDLIQAGDSIEYDEVQGTVIAVTAVKTIIRIDEGKEASFSNQVLVANRIVTTRYKSPD